MGTLFEVCAIPATESAHCTIGKFQKGRGRLGQVYFTPGGPGLLVSMVASC
jgi:biotin-(acetyl-CoA carboxylase) ligase